MSSTTWSGLDPRIKSRSIAANGLDIHYLESTASPTSDTKHPLIILLHGFPEIAYSWRKLILPLSAAGYHVVAPDQRGYGRTKMLDVQAGVTTSFEDNVSPFRISNVVTDVVALVLALGYQSVAAVIGHDFGSSVAGACALVRPDMFRSVVLMSAPFTGPPTFNKDGSLPQKSLGLRLNEGLAQLNPPRKHYTVYYSTPEAAADMTNPPRDLHAFLRAYFHVKSADWAPNKPHPLSSPSPSSFAELPLYYVMHLHETMPQSVERDAPTTAEIECNTWLPDEELAVYVSEYTRTGFQGGLNHYRCMTDTKWQKDLLLFAGKRIEVPAMFISGKQDWGVYQYPGAVDAMRSKACQAMDEEDFVLIDKAGHWVQQEQTEEVLDHLKRFLREVGSRS